MCLIDSTSVSWLYRCVRWYIYFEQAHGLGLNVKHVDLYGGLIAAAVV